MTSVAVLLPDLKARFIYKNRNEMPLQVLSSFGFIRLCGDTVVNRNTEAAVQLLQ